MNTAKEIGEKIRTLRIARRLPQQSVAKTLEVSQATISRLESGKESLTVDQLLRVCRLFNVPPSHLLPEEGAATAQVRRSLIRHGAANLVDDEKVLPSERLSDVKEVLKEVLIAAESPREVAALAPVLVQNAGQLSLQDLALDLARLDSRFHRRVGWLLENTLAAVEKELEGAPPHAWRVRYLRAKALFAPELKALQRKWDPIWGSKIPSQEDILDTDLTSKQSIEEAQGYCSQISRNWNVISRLQVSDFVNALREGRR